ncbi:MAX network transcriptional repressor b [Denticeps clupeoides]|uniref:Max-binding protein MNT n=1 Tax=Denticeps clupeoides TaxID=299321 RepID=A0AAY4A4E8_9TELE|nr:max-binding protein MNT-like [Denticeps clupeoides]
MSIETLLEAARYLEWQAQQQQITREEEERQELAILNREAEQQRRTELTTPVVQPVQESRLEQLRHQHLPPVPPPPLPPSVPITVIPFPVVSANSAPQRLPAGPQIHTPTPVPVVTPLSTALPPQATPLLSPAPMVNGGKDGISPPNQRQRPLVAHLKAENGTVSQAGNSPKQLQQSQQPQQAHAQPHLLPSYSPIIAPTQHALLPQTTITQPQPPIARPNGATLEDLRAMDGKRRPGGAGTREVHNKLEKNRRAHLKECFETLKKNVPNVDEKKTSNLSVLRSALRYIQTLKRKEKEYEHEMERLAREKIATQQRLAELRNELSQAMDVGEIDRLLRQSTQPEDDQASTSTASEGEDNFDLDVDDDVVSSPPNSNSRPSHASLVPDVRLSLPPPTLLPVQQQQHITLQPHRPLDPSAVHTQAITPAPPPSGSIPTHVMVPQVQPPPQQPTVIAHASVSHASVIQTINHVLPVGPKHLPHIAPSATPTVPAAVGQPIGHITVHPVAHLSQHLPTLYPQSVAVTQPTVVGHITHALTPHHGHGAVPTPAAQAAATVVGKPATVVAHHHPQLVGQTVLNPVTMVTMPPFPVSTLKLA